MALGREEVVFIYDTTYTLKTHPIMAAFSCQNDLRNTHFMAHPLVSSLVGSSETNQPLSTRSGKLVNKSTQLLDAAAVIVKHDVTTNVPLQISMALANGIWQQRIANQDLVIRELTKNSSQRVVRRLQEDPQQDMGALYTQAAEVAVAQQYKANATLATCNILLHADNNHQARLVNMGDNIIVIVGPDGLIKNQLAATRYAIETAGTPLVYRPSHLSDLSTFVEEDGFRKEHLFTQTLSVAPDDIIITLSDGAWHLFEHETSESQYSRHYITDDSEEAFNVNRSQVIYQKQTRLRVNALQPFVVGNNVHQINRALSQFMLEETNRQQQKLQLAISEMLEVFPSLHQEPQVATINSVIELLPIGSMQRMRLISTALKAGYSLTSTNDLLHLWTNYTAFIRGVKENNLWEILPVDETTLRVFLNAFMPVEYDNVITVGDFLNTLPTAASDRIRQLLLTPNDNNTISNREAAPFREFLVHNLYHVQRGDCTAVTVVKVPDYNTELVRSWVEFSDEVTRSAIFAKLLAAECNEQHIATALRSLGQETYVKNSAPPQGVKWDAINLVPRYMPIQLQKTGKELVYLIAQRALETNRPDVAISAVSNIFSFYGNTYRRFKNDPTLNTHRRKALDKALGIATPNTKSRVLDSCREHALRDIFAKVDALLQTALTQDPSSLVQSIDETVMQLQTAKQHELFNEHLPNFWFTGKWGKTEAVKMIDKKLTALTQTRMQMEAQLATTQTAGQMPRTP